MEVCDASPARQIRGNSPTLSIHKNAFFFKNTAYLFTAATVSVTIKERSCAMHKRKLGRQGIGPQVGKGLYRPLLPGPAGSEHSHRRHGWHARRTGSVREGPILRPLRSRTRNYPPSARRASARGHSDRILALGTRR